MMDGVVVELSLKRWNAGGDRPVCSKNIHDYNMVDLLAYVFIFMTCVSCIYDFDSYYDNTFEISIDEVKELSQVQITNPYLYYWCWVNSFLSKVLTVMLMVFEYVFILHIILEVSMMMLNLLE
ncbi:hypothetical protein ACI65C_004274 [Semiaphis heraclei]